jgi:hypothetical protein
LTVPDAASPPTPTTIPLIDTGAASVRRLRYMDELVGRRRIRLAGDRGVTITHTIRAGFEEIGRMLDPVFRVYLSEKLASTMDDHMRAEFPKLATLLHRGAPWRR